MLREERIVLQPDMLLLFKALITIDGVLSGIQSDFDLSAALRRASSRIVEARLAPERWTRRAAALALELDRLGDDLPRLIRATTRKLESEQAVVYDGRHRSRDPHRRRLDRRSAGSVGPRHRGRDAFR